MKNDKFGELAKELGVSKSTVSKAARHCSGVDSDTRRIILGELKKKNLKNSGEYDIYCIVPDTPTYFWDGIRRGVNTVDEKISMKYNIITKVNDSDTVIDYITEAEEMRAKVLVISSNITPEIEARISGMRDRPFIIFLSEGSDMTHSFYIGSDPHKDGEEMGKIYIDKYADRRLLIISNSAHNGSSKRTAGFTEILRSAKISDNASIIDASDIMPYDSKIFPSKLAAILAKNSGIGCIYLTDGVTQLSVAINKAGLKGKLVCLCHDIPPDEDCVSVSCNQDVFAQGKAAIDAAVKYLYKNSYPESKYTFIPSQITVYKR